MSGHAETIPTVDLSVLQYDRDSVLTTLRHALVDYGFFYLINYEDHLSHDIIEALADQTERFFNLPQEDKDKIQMVNSKHFLGYNGLEKEITAGKIDWREQIDFCSTDTELAEYDNLYENLVGPNQYPDAKKLPYFQKTIKYFLDGMDTFSVFLMKLIFESLSVNQHQYSKYFNINQGESNFNKMKLIRYPSEKELKSHSTLKESTFSQGCGPHKDSDFLTYLFSPTEVTSLQVQNLQGKWLSVDPIPKSIIINVGQTLEYLTSGVCLSSIHRVKTSSTTSRISIPFFQNVKIESVLQPLKLDDGLLKLRDERDLDRKQSVAFQFKPSLDEPIAVSVFKNRIKSHRDVSGKWWPKQLALIDEEERKAKESLESTPREKNPELLAKVLRLTKIFKTFHSTLVMELMRVSVDLTLRYFIPKVKLSHPTVSYSDLLKLFTIWPDFIVISINFDGDVVIDLEKTDRLPKINDMDYMNGQFEKRCEAWVNSNKYADDIPPLQLHLVKPEVDFQKLDKEMESRIKERKNKNTTIPASSKISKPSNTKKENSTMSILERIRMKEKARKENYQSPTAKRDQFLDSKLLQVLNILFTLSKRSQSISRLSEIIKNSLSSTSAISMEDAEAVIKRLCVKFPDIFVFVNGKSLKVLKWNEFQLSTLKKRLDETDEATTK
ncbi:hypothetical protein WICPIJ_003422 [Wickerhamomyces pijperi]|uniref:Fe2OG dioxygenase domain-containing protein n=1 Tax=Wickerhamomyces pijperi TaxID=599730 RepID=A0A9P8Q769_WICPI|nr:hypothetical protein WICPIJ_003422 [Wickerhamomyces pijperi]